MTQKEINQLCNLFQKCGYNVTSKATFKRLAMKLLRELRAELKIDADIRYNAAGVACSVRFFRADIRCGHSEPRPLMQPEAACSIWSQSWSLIFGRMESPNFCKPPEHP